MPKTLNKKLHKKNGSAFSALMFFLWGGAGTGLALWLIQAVHII